MEKQDQKKVDSDWKNLINKERQTAEEKKEVYHQPTFSIFLSSLGMQAMIAMGKLENPLTGKTDANYEQARFLIDTLGIIQEKTKNNLAPDEVTLLDEFLFYLRMLYVEAKKT